LKQQKHLTLQENKEQPKVKLKDWIAWEEPEEGIVQTLVRTAICRTCGRRHEQGIPFKKPKEK